MAEGGRLFTRDELDEMGKNFNQLALEALDAGDTVKARYWIEKNEETKYAIHDLYMHWVADLLGRLYKKLGKVDYFDLLRTTVKRWVTPFYETKNEMLKAGGLKAYVDFLVNAWRQHCGEFTVEEDDEKIILKHQPCGSGGRLVNEGAYEGESGYLTIDESGPYTWGKEGIPVYCTHCPQAHMIIGIESLGKGQQLWAHDHDRPFPQKPGDPCIHYIYKDTEKVPGKYYEYIGMDK